MIDAVLPTAAFVAGAALLVTTVLSVLWTLVVPRATPSTLAEAVIKGVRGIFVAAAWPWRGYRAKDRILAMQPPVALLALLVVWLGLLALAYALLARPWSGETGVFGMLVAMTGSVLGLDASGIGPVQAASLSAVLSGVIVVALLIGYLPTLYGAFNERERLVSLLETRASSPAWGVELLARSARDGTLDDLPELYTAWEHWAADVGETHTSYPILGAFRSPHPDRSWLTSLLAVLDAAALEHALRPESAPVSARLALRTGFMSLRAIAEVLGVDHDPDPHPDSEIQLAKEDFDDAVRKLAAVGYPAERDVDAAWPHFRGWRVNYEQVVYALAAALHVPPAPWSGPRPRMLVESRLPRRPVDRKPSCD
ncbi:hypothetical protein [Haloechinothrix sp. LS1_15]|uniref:hypothetical protein n=1 Tax=Haloechinothrix sp. LS1_15 TaxID=2652248 RepID=UPI0029446BB4|nr:hypothetical protein [Haloechinothrix sp. LS1_15]MDV6012320.1 hypothetical protein [Haloechinothrix sp. LS1_15]